jgi:hypothetical protein
MTRPPSFEAYVIVFGAVAILALTPIVALIALAVALAK